MSFIVSTTLDIGKNENIFDGEDLSVHQVLRGVQMLTIDLHWKQDKLTIHTLPVIFALPVMIYTAIDDSLFIGKGWWVHASLSKISM